MVGKILAHYEILKRLGAGAMGEVYLARDTKLARKVALKVLPPDLARDPERLMRFEREARALARIAHPNIVAIHSVEEADGIHFLTMELVDGETLDRVIPEGGLPLERIFRMAVPLADALATAHEGRIVHRDLKPANVMLTAEDERVKVLDFGLAKLLSESEDPEETLARTAGLTGDGMLVGTVAYMSPEQAEGRVADPRSDVFSLGAVLYEMAAGDRAFHGDSPATLIASILRDAPPPIAARRPDLPRHLGRIIEHCLEKNLKRRFQSARDVHYELESLMSETETAAELARSEVAADARRDESRGGGSGGTAWKAVLGGAGVLVAALGLWLWLGDARSGDRAPGTDPGQGLAGWSSAGTGTATIAVLPFENQGPPEGDYFSDGVSDEVRGKLASLSGVNVIARGSSTPYKGTEKRPREIARELGATHLLTGTIRWDASMAESSRIRVSPEFVSIPDEGTPTTAWQQSFDAVLSDVFAVQGDIATRVAEAVGVTLDADQRESLGRDPTASLGAYDAYLRGEQLTRDFGEVDRPTMRLAVREYARAVELDPAFADAWAQLSRAYSWIVRELPAPEDVEAARSAADRAMQLAPGSPKVQLAMGRFEEFVNQDLQAAWREFSKGLEANPSRSDLLSGTAGVERRLGRWQEAISHSQRAWQLDPRSTAAARIYGSTLVRVRRYRDAIQVVDRALELAPDNLTVWRWKLSALLGLGELEEARRVVADLMEFVDPGRVVVHTALYGERFWVLSDEQQRLLLRQTSRAFDGDVADWALTMAHIHYLRGEIEEARHQALLAAEAYEAQQREAGDSGTETLSFDAFRGVAFAYAGEREQALNLAKGLGERLATTDDHYSRPYYRHQLARLYLVLGENGLALAEIESVLAVPYTLSVAWMGIDPIFAPLRDHPRFRELARKYG